MHLALNGVALYGTHMDSRKEQIRLRLSKGEKEALERAAGEMSIPVATWVRSVALAAAKEKME